MRRFRDLLRQWADWIDRTDVPVLTDAILNVEPFTLNPGETAEFNITRGTVTRVIPPRQRSMADECTDLLREQRAEVTAAAPSPKLSLPADHSESSATAAPVSTVAHIGSARPSTRKRGKR